MGEMSFAALADMEPHGRIAAAKALYVQTYGRLQLGHELNMFTERAWNGLKRAAQDETRYSPHIRCTECSAIGSLDEWLLCLNSCCGKWDRYKEKLGLIHAERVAYMERKCDHRDRNLAIDFLGLWEEG